MNETTPSDPAMFAGKIVRAPAENVAKAILPDESIAAIVGVASNGTPVLFVNPRYVAEHCVGLLELWARRMVAQGRRSAELDIDDLRAYPDLFPAG